MAHDPGAAAASTTAAVPAPDPDASDPGGGAAGPGDASGLGDSSGSGGNAPGSGGGSSSSGGDSSGRGDPWAAAAALVGAAGAGIAVAQNMPVFYAVLQGPALPGDTAPWWRWLVPAAGLVAMVLVGALARRWGWVVAVGVLAIHVGLIELGPQSLDVYQLVTIMVVTGGAALGGAVAAFGAGDRLTRLAIGCGLPLGLFGGHQLLVVFTYPDLIDPNASMGEADRWVLITTPLVLCAAAALVWLVRHPQSRAGVSGSLESAATSGWATLAVTLAAAVGLTHVYPLTTVIVDELGRARGGLRNFDAGRTILQMAPLVLAVVAGVALAIYAYRRGGGAASRWAMAALAIGLSVPFSLTFMVVLWIEPGRMWLAGSAGVAGALVGAVASRVTLVPWDALGLLGLAVATALQPSPNLVFFNPGTSGWEAIVVFLLGFVLAVALTTLGASRRIGGTGETAALAGLGFVLLLPAASTIGPSSMSSLTSRPGLPAGVAVAIAAVVVLVAYGLDQRAARRAAKAKALPAT